MRIFLAGATGVIGSRLVPLLVAAGHRVGGMTRSPDKAGPLAAQGAEPIVCDAYDADAVTRAVVGFAPTLVMHQLTDLPDDAGELAAARGANARMRRDGTRNLLAAARAAEVDRFVAQSVAWKMTGEGQDAKAYLERVVLDAGGVVLRYGQLYGSGTFYPDEPPDHPRIHVDAAAERTLAALDAPSGVLVLAEQ